MPLRQYPTIGVFCGGLGLSTLHGKFTSITSIIFRGSVIMALGKPNWNMALALINLGVGAMAIFASVSFGLVPTAFSYAISGIAGYSVGLWLARRLLRFHFAQYFTNLVPPLLGAIVMFGVLQAVSPFLLTSAPELVRLGVNIAAGISVYFALLRIMRPRLLTELVELGLLVIPVKRDVDH